VTIFNPQNVKFGLGDLDLVLGLGCPLTMVKSNLKKKTSGILPWYYQVGAGSPKSWEEIMEN